MELGSLETPVDDGAMAKESTSRPWALVLAAGEGARVRCLTCDRRGRCAPKQFWSVDGHRSLVGYALERAAGIAPRDRIVVIVPSPECAEVPLPVACFYEKPDISTTANLVERGALLNSFIMVGHVRRLLSLFETTLPQLWQRFEGLDTLPGGSAGDWERLADLYDSIPSLDFSRDILQRSARDLSVYPVPSCGWTDLGTPQRLTRHVLRVTTAGGLNVAAP